MLRNVTFGRGARPKLLQKNLNILRAIAEINNGITKGVELESASEAFFAVPAGISFPNRAAGVGHLAVFEVVPALRASSDS